MTAWPTRSPSRVGFGSRRIGDVWIWLRTRECEMQVLGASSLTRHCGSARLYLEWARLSAPNRRSMDYIYMPEHEMTHIDE